MKRIVGAQTKKKPSPVSSKEHLEKLSNREKDLEIKIKNLENDLRRTKDQLNRLRESPGKAALKQKALRILGQKRYFENQLEAVRGFTYNLDQTNFTAQVLKDTQQTISFMKDGMKQIKNEFKKLNVEDIDNMQDDLADLMLESEEIRNSMMRSYDTPLIDEDELEAELDALGDEIALDDDQTYIEDALGNVQADSVNNLPEPPNNITTENGIVIDQFGLPEIPKRPV